MLRICFLGCLTWCVQWSLLGFPCCVGFVTVHDVCGSLLAAVAVKLVSTERTRREFVPSRATVIPCLFDSHLRSFRASSASGQSAKCKARLRPAYFLNSLPQNGHEVILTCDSSGLSGYSTVIVVGSRLLVGRRMGGASVAFPPRCRNMGTLFGGVGCRLCSFVLPAIVCFDVCRHAVFDCLQLVSLFLYPVV